MTRSLLCDNDSNMDTSMSTNSTRKPYKRLSDKEVKKVIDVATGNLTNQEIADLVGSEKSNITRVLQRYNVEVDRENDYNKNRVQIFRGLQERLLNGINDEDIKKLSVPQRMMGVGILVDKEQALLGNGGNKPVINIIHQDPRASVQVHDNTIDITIGNAEHE